MDNLTVYLCILSSSVFVISICFAFNVEEKKVEIISGEESGSQFGYTVALVNEKGWDPTGSQSVNKDLLVGAPNLTVDGIRGHGDVYACGPTTTKDAKCTPLQMKDPSNLCVDRLIKHYNATRSPCEEDSRMGATMAVNRNFTNNFNNFADVPMVTMCAPGWKSVLKEDRSSYEKYMYGMCLKIRNNFNVLDCPVTDQFSYCWPFWAGNKDNRTQSNDHGWSVFAYAVGGLSATFTHDGAEVIGAPGVNRNRGSCRSWMKNWLFSKGWETDSTTYYGYSLDYGYFKGMSAIVVGNPNFYNTSGAYGHYGKVELKNSVTEIAIDFFSYKVCNLTDETNRPSNNSKQIGTKFGWSVAAIDITGDSYAEIFVGAPLYSDKEVEEGRVYVFTEYEDVTGDSYAEIFVGAPLYSDKEVEEGRVYVFTEYEKEFCMMGSLSGSAQDYSMRDEVSYGRFGTSITNAGDLDGDGYRDIAIGAPYENGGSGVVYIYRGIGDCDCFIPDIYSQRIVGSSIDPMVQSFGWSLYGNEDVDDNGFPDIAVGAYMSDKAFILRTKPIVRVNITMTISPNPIPLNQTDIECSKNRTNICMKLTMRVDVKGIAGRQITDTIGLSWTLFADTLFKEKNGYSRAVFRNNTMSLLNGTLVIENGRSEEGTFIVDVMEGPRGSEPPNPWTPLLITGYYELVPTAGEAFDKLDYMLPATVSTNMSTEASFASKCKNIVNCTSNLNLTVDINLLKNGRPERVTQDTVLYVDAKDQMEISLEVTNTLNTSYQTLIIAEVGTKLQRIIENKTEDPMVCQVENMNISSAFECSVRGKLGLNEEITVKAMFDVSRATLVKNIQTLENMKDSINISVITDQENTDVNKEDNIFDISIPVKIKSELDITVDNAKSFQTRFMDHSKSTRDIEIHHRYFVTNNGPSFLPKTFVNISIPRSKDGVTFARIQATPLCSERGKMAHDTTTDIPLKTTTPPIYEYQEEYEYSATEELAFTFNLSESESQPTRRDITCNDYECVVFECKLVEMNNGDTQILDLDIMVAEKEIARIKGVTEVRFVTVAEATSPTVWYSDKVVPWQRRVAESKVTTFFVEPESVGSEVNIWIIIGSVLGAVAIIIIIIIVLWRCGFFTRKKQEDLRRMKRESLYKRRSQARASAMGGSVVGNNPTESIEES